MLNHNGAASDERRVVVVTGAGGSGCGRAIAARFACAGALVVVSDINEAGGHDTVQLIERGGGRAAFCRAHVRKESEVHDLISFAEQRMQASPCWSTMRRRRTVAKASRMGWRP